MRQEGPLAVSSPHHIPGTNQALFSAQIVPPSIVTQSWAVRTMTLSSLSCHPASFPRAIYPHYSWHVLSPPLQEVSPSVKRPSGSSGPFLVAITISNPHSAASGTVVLLWGDSPFFHSQPWLKPTGVSHSISLAVETGVNHRTETQLCYPGTLGWAFTEHIKSGM